MPQMLVCALILCLLLVSCWAFADAFNGAQWIRDPMFKDVPVIPIEHKQQQPRPQLFGPKNVHTLFRREIVLPAKPVSATACLTGDDYYKFYINGQFVVQGPEPGYPFTHPYYELDVTPFLVEGANCLAAHAYYQGLCNRAWNSADNRSGFILVLKVAFENVAAAVYVTDASWRCHTLAAFPTSRIIGKDIQFAEDIDMRAVPAGWQDPEFDDLAWDTPLVGRQDHVFVKQETPPLEVYRADPVIAQQAAEGRYFYDFGIELVGHTRVRIQGPAGHIIEVRHGEELEKPETVRYQMRANCTYQEFPVLSGGDDLIEFYDYRAFRYIEILNAPTEPQVWVDVRHHPFRPGLTRLASSDNLLAQTWELCKNGVRFGAQGSFLDCPSREKGQYLGDALITSHAHLLLTADGSLTRKALADFQHSQRICPGMMAVAPGSFMQEIAEYSLQWTLALRNYYRLTGDRVFAERMVDAAFGGLYGYFARFESDAGLLTGMTEKWVLVDWPENLRDDYDYEYAKTRENTVLNAFYYASLRAAADLLRAFDRDAAAYEAKAERVRQAFATRLLDADTGLFVDAPGSAHHSLHANAVPLCFGLVAEENVSKVLALIRGKRLQCGVYIAPFVIEACYRAGDFELGYDLLTSKDEHSWHEMLRHDATTCMEVWGPDQKWNTSWCHPWSSSPVFLTIEQVMGLNPAAPGWRKVTFAPRVPASLDRLEITFPTVRGGLAAQYRKGEGFVLTVPPGVTLEQDVPNGAPVTIKVDDALTEAQQACLQSLGWSQRVGDGLGVWVSISDQMCRVIHEGCIRWQARCATAANGPGAEEDSEKTPLGWHCVVEKVGEGAAWGQVFRSRQPVAQIWKPDDRTDEDLVLTRILLLDGMEPGKNKGGNVDSFARNIYIHGTNAEDRIGTPSSHGCIRLTNDDVIAAFDVISEGTLVLITE